MQIARVVFIILILGSVSDFFIKQADASTSFVVKTRCMACHSFEQGARHRTGPNLYGIIGRKAGTAAGYRYSADLKDAGFVWTAEKLRLWLADSRKAIRKLTGNPKAKTRMPPQKLSGAKLDEVIVYLESISPGARMMRLSRASSASMVVPEKVSKIGAPRTARESVHIQAGEIPSITGKPAPKLKSAPAASISSPALKRRRSRPETARVEHRVKASSASRAPSRVIASVQPMMVDPETDPTAGLSPTAAGPEAEIFPATKNSHNVSIPKKMKAPAASVIRKPDKYKVVLGADSLIKIPGIPGELRVWIGLPEYKATLLKDMSRAIGMIAAVGKTAKVTPFSTGLKIEPEESLCMKVHPTGSEVRFKLIPVQEGVFNVGADVLLFDSDDCSGSPVPKAAKTLQVEVKVNKEEIRKNRIEELLTVLWEKFMDFWGAVVALFFGAVLFLLRRQLKKWFGYEADGK